MSAVWYLQGFLFVCGDAEMTPNIDYNQHDEYGNRAVAPARWCGTVALFVVWGTFVVATGNQTTGARAWRFLILILRSVISYHRRQRLFPSRTIFSFFSFSILQWRSLQMCCEQMTCYVAVFDHMEAVCYLKGTGAVHTYDYVDKEGFTSHEMLFREGMRVATRGTHHVFCYNLRKACIYLFTYTRYVGLHTASCSVEYASLSNTKSRPLRVLPSTGTRLLSILYIDTVH